MIGGGSGDVTFDAASRRSTDMMVRANIKDSLNFEQDEHLKPDGDLMVCHQDSSLIDISPDNLGLSFSDCGPDDRLICRLDLLCVLSPGI